MKSTEVQHLLYFSKLKVLSPFKNKSTSYSNICISIISRQKCCLLVTGTLMSSSRYAYLSIYYYEFDVPGSRLQKPGSHCFLRHHHPEQEVSESLKGWNGDGPCQVVVLHLSLLIHHCIDCIFIWRGNGGELMASPVSYLMVRQGPSRTGEEPLRYEHLRRGLLGGKPREGADAWQRHKMNTKKLT